LRIATYNVNSVNARLQVLLRWLSETQPDIACLQELKAPQDKFPGKAIREAGYGVIWHGQKSYNGVAILAEGVIQSKRSGDCRATRMTSTVATSKQALALRASELVGRDSPVILAGDYNVMPTDIDVYKPERWVDDALFRPETRAA
jgi:exodeoxyribonuclease-3